MGTAVLVWVLALQPNFASAQNTDPGRSSATVTKNAASTRTASAETTSANQKHDASEAETPFGAFSNSNRGPINIVSDSLNLDYKANKVLFAGRVHATQADAQLSSNTLDVQYGKDFHEIQNAVANGDVHMSQGLRFCTSQHGVLNQVVHTVVLTGNPVCHDGADVISGPKITVHLDTGKSVVEGGVKAIFFPRQTKTSDNGTSAANHTNTAVDPVK